MARRRWLLLAALPVLAALLGLGTWQVQRLHWKTALLDRLAAAEAAPPLPLGPLGAGPPAPFAKLYAEGRLDHAREVRLGFSVRDGAPGAQLLTPLLRDGAPPVLIDRGWVPLAGGAIERPAGPLRITGYARPADTRDWNSPQDDAAQRRFYLFDPAAIGAAIGLPGLAPFGLVALDPAAAPGALPAAARRLPRPENPHLGYAITWFGLAAALVGVVVAVLWQGRRR